MCITIAFVFLLYTLIICNLYVMFDELSKELIVEGSRIKKRI